MCECTQNTCLPFPLANLGKSWQILANLGKSWQVLVRLELLFASPCAPQHKAQHEFAALSCFASRPTLRRNGSLEAGTPAIFGRCATRGRDTRGGLVFHRNCTFHRQLLALVAPSLIETFSDKTQIKAQTRGQPPAMVVGFPGEERAAARTIVRKVSQLQSEFHKSEVNAG